MNIYCASYFQTLKFLAPIIKEDKNACFVFVSHLGLSSEDCKSSVRLLKKINIPYALVDDSPSPGKSKMRQYFDIFNFLFLIRKTIEKKKVSNIILTTDTKLFERILVDYAYQKKIRTVCLQWSFGPISKLSYIESRLGKIFSDLNQTEISDIYPLKKSRRSTTLILRIILGFYEIKYRPVFQTYGGGNSDFLLTLGRSSLDFFSELGIEKGKVFSLGHPKVNTNTNCDALSISKVVNILFCDNHYHERYRVNHENNRKLIFETIDRIFKKYKKNYNLIYRPHPRMEREGNFSAHENIIIDTNPNLIGSLYRSDVFINVSSTSLLDALFECKPSFALDFFPTPMSSYYKELGWYLYYDNAIDFEVAISDLIENTNKFSNEYFKERLRFIERNLSPQLHTMNKKDSYFSRLKNYLQ